jgi:hypothetical protein
MVQVRRLAAVDLSGLGPKIGTDQEDLGSSAAIGSMRDESKHGHRSHATTTCPVIFG